MMLKQLPHVLIIFLGLAVPAAAQDCAQANTQADMNRCAGEAFMQADAALNAAYADLRRELEDEAERQVFLTKAQRAWLALRDAECDFKTAESRGGSIHPMLVQQCRTELTARRTGELQAHAACVQADNSACLAR
jgi:uncharacterized protein YecT (DUF1311 family)